jgi:hypothetical protein
VRTRPLCRVKTEFQNHPEGLVCIIIALYNYLKLKYFAKAVQQMFEYLTANTIKKFLPGENYVRVREAFKKKKVPNLGHLPKIR